MWRLTSCGTKHLKNVLKVFDHLLILIFLVYLCKSCQNEPQLMNFSPLPAGPALHMATVDIKNPEINNVRFHNSHSHQQPYHLNNMLSHSGLSRKDKKTKGKKKKLTKADIGTPSNFQ